MSFFKKKTNHKKIPLRGIYREGFLIIITLHLVLSKIFFLEAYKIKDIETHQCCHTVSGVGGVVRRYPARVQDKAIPPPPHPIHLSWRGFDNTTLVCGVCGVVRAGPAHGAGQSPSSSHPHHSTLFFY